MDLDRKILVPVVCSLAALLTACGGGEKKVAAPAPTKTSETTVTSAPAPEPKRVSPSIAVSEEIARACSLHFDDIVTAPKFDFDRSELLAGDRDVLDKIGRCVTTGPLQGRTIKLVGRADPRGTQDYNLALGARRAHSVTTFLEQLGVDPSHIRETSRGELDAVGTDEASWMLDRRVDILLAE